MYGYDLSVVTRLNHIIHFIRTQYDEQQEEYKNEKYNPISRVTAVTNLGIKMKNIKTKGKSIFKFLRCLRAI